MEFRYSIQYVQALSTALAVVLDQAVLTDAFIKGSTELYLNFKMKDSLFCIQINCKYRAAFFLFFDKEMQRMSGVQPKFQEVIGKKILTVEAFEKERIFCIQFEENKTLLMKCFGPLLNVLYFKNEQFIEMFRTQMKQDSLFNLKELSNLKRYQPNSQIHFYYVYEFKNQFFIDTNPKVHSHLKLKSIDLLEALTEFGLFELKRLQFEEAKLQLLASIHSKINKCKRIVANNQTKIQFIENAVPPEEIGHLILSNLQFIQKGDTQVQVFDYFRNNNLTIALNGKLSATENAAVYFRKSKNKRLEVKNALELIQKNEIEIKQLEKALLETELIQHLKQINKTQLPESSAKSSLFKEFEFEHYTILVGRNSKNNDVLTFQHAHKEDIWLHAKGVSGSHVVIKRKGSSSIPEPVIHRAAELAAYFSKAKSSSMVLVMFTERKFVRKFKSALPGQVIVEKEHTILVAPRLN